MTKAKDGLNIVIPDDQEKQPKSPEALIQAENFNKTHKLPTSFLEDLHDESGDHSDLSISKCQDKIDKNLKLIEEEKAKLEQERQNKRPSTGKKSKSKNRHTAPKSTREGYKRNKRPNSHKKRGSASNMHEQLKKKMGITNSHSSRGRGRDQFLNYSLDEINQKLQAKARNYNTSTGNKNKKRLNKSFENVFSA